MAKQKLTLQEQLNILEAKKNQLLDKRRKELVRIIESTGAIEINDKLLTSTLLFLLDAKNKNHPVLEEFKNYLKPRNKQKNTANSTNTSKKL